MYEWKENYRIGDERLDEQHQKLFQICARIEGIFENNDKSRHQRAVEEAIKYLKSYTLQHFADEEAYQLQIGYKGYAIHKRLHENFKKVMVRYEEDLVNSDYHPEQVDRLLGIVKAWLVNHIMNADQKITPGE